MRPAQEFRYLHNRTSKNLRVEYQNTDGQLIATVTRYDPPTGKEFRPWDVTARKHKAPNPRPLYNQPGIGQNQDVLLVEGEKCAEALIKEGFGCGSLATTNDCSYLRHDSESGHRIYGMPNSLPSHHWS